MSSSIAGNELVRPSTPPGIPPPSAKAKPPSFLSFGTVCSSNINRSMEAHLVLGNAGLRVESYGTGTTVRLPGRSAMEPRVFKFGTLYSEMYKSMSGTPEDVAFFNQNGVLGLCRRGAAVKPAPQRWQDTPNEVITQHDVAIAFEERIFDAVVEDLQTREPTEDFAPIHVICLDTKDNPHEAKIQGRIALELCWLLEETAKRVGREGLVDQIPEILDAFQTERMKHTPIKVLHQLCYL
jgi:RNA polymerase II subunit A C-terminal domain phosphatase SSU72